ncbi:hypothetical protein, partial [Leucobacter chromiiresistens]
RAVAALEGPLAESVRVVGFALGAGSRDAAEQLGIDPAAPAVDEALQRRIGVAAGTPVRIDG